MELPFEVSADHALTIGDCKKGLVSKTSITADLMNIHQYVLQCILASLCNIITTIEFSQKKVASSGYTFMGLLMMLVH